jgi:hypothetical protein
MRARIVLACADPCASDTALAQRLGVNRQNVVTCRQPLLTHRPDRLSDTRRSSAPRRVRNDEIKHLIALTLATQPADATHWSARSMAKHVKLSQTMVSHVWRSFGLQPHGQETFKLSRGPAFVDKARGAVGLHLNPHDRALVLCVEEKSQVQAVEGTTPLLPMRPGQVERRSRDYRRHGSTDLFAALNVKTGERGWRLQDTSQQRRVPRPSWIRLRGLSRPIWTRI